MAMNRETKRMLQRQGSLNAEGDPVAPAKKPGAKAPKPASSEPRLPPHKWLRRYLREVMSEMRKVNFPTKQEVRTYSIIVFTMLLIVTSVIGLLDFGLSHAILKVFN